MNRRTFLELAAVSPVPAGERYRLGCETLPYGAHPLPRALEGIRKAGYRYVMVHQTHAKQPAFTPALSPAARAQLRAQLRDAGLTPFMSFLGRSADIREPGALKAWQEEMDLNLEFGIRTVVTAGPWYYTKFPNVPKRARDWQKECDEFYPKTTTYLCTPDWISAPLWPEPTRTSVGPRS
jgi:sugar phosphate isomerase/epimerase